MSLMPPRVTEARRSHPRAHKAPGSEEPRQEEGYVDRRRDPMNNQESEIWERAIAAMNRLAEAMEVSAGYRAKPVDVAQPPVVKDPVPVKEVS